MSGVVLYDTMTREKRELVPAEAGHLKMYVCGPTVYARPHIGNARSVVVYDVLYRLLKASFPRVTYARNITDVDDKINAAAIERGISISALTEEVTRGFHADMAALNCLPPTTEPKATGHIAEIIEMIEALIRNGHAYEADGHVLFDTGSVTAGPYRYGQLSGRKAEDLIAGARVEVQGYKKNPGDFVLWKPASGKDDASSVFDSPWGRGRPGWHIECSAMSTKHLGLDFDLHGGGADLMFPHHENEIAQSTCAHPGSVYAKMWVHNGFLTVDGEKMSKSLGNFITVEDLLARGVKGEVIRYALLSTHYRKPLDWTEKLLEDAAKSLDYLYRALQGDIGEGASALPVLDDLREDLNVPKALATLTRLASETLGEKDATHQAQKRAALKAGGALLGLLQQDVGGWFHGIQAEGEVEIDTLIEQRVQAKMAKDWAEADRIRHELTAQGILLEDRPDGSTGWRRK